MIELTIDRPLLSEGVTFAVIALIARVDIHLVLFLDFGLTRDLVLCLGNSRRCSLCGRP